MKTEKASLRLHFRDKTRLRMFRNNAAAGSCFIERVPAGTDFEAQTSFAMFQRLKHLFNNWEKIQLLILQKL